MNISINSLRTKINANRLTFNGDKKEQTAPTTKPQKPDTFEKQPVEADIFYIADLHGKMTNMERICSVSKQFDNMKSNGAKLKLASGDILLGSNPMTNKVASHFLNWIGVSANALGNHEMDATPDALASTLSDAKYDLLASNVTVDPKSPMANKIKKSIIKEYNGQKFGIIGTAPSDALERVGTRESLQDIRIDDIDTTIKKVQEEVDKLKAQGINKIIVLSHIGKEMDKRLAQETDGIDIILGGHTHDLYKDVKEGDNLLYSKSNEPVLLTQIGKDGEYAGILKTAFDEKGVLVKAQNNVIKSTSYSRTLPFKTAVESIIGKPEILAEIKTAPPAPQNRLLSNNPHGNVIVDAMRHELGTDVAILNAGNIRGFFPEGKIDSRRINDVTPFEDKMMICKLSEKQIVDAIKVGAKSFEKSDSKPGILLVSGLEYTVTDKGQLVSLNFVDKNGNKVPIDVNNPSDTKKFTVACDDFFAFGGDNYLPVNQNPDYVVKKFDKDKNFYTANYIKNQPQPLEIKEDDRIKIIKG